MTPSEARLLDHALERLAVVSGTLELVPTVRLDRFANGYFHTGSRRVQVALGFDVWSGTLAHELGHVEQMIAGTFRGSASWHTFDRWLARREPVTPRSLLSAVRTIQKCEHDAERHALSLIRAFDLPVDEKQYAREANAYLWKHEVARRSRFWSGDHVVPLCPARLISLRDIGNVPLTVESVLAKPNDKRSARDHHLSFDV